MNDNARWTRIKQLFQESQEKQPHERDDWLVIQCAGDDGLLHEVHKLLQAQQGSHNILDRSAVNALNQLSIAGAASLVGQRVGSYHLVRLLGEGGMGSVYLAEREESDVKLCAALKFIRADLFSEDARVRFLRERRILAQLTHAHIAQLHDAGMMPNGSPYFTLEYVEGEPITKYCDARQLTLRERLRLVLQVCAAVAYAHRNLIVHRDLKPSNIFVTAEGQVKLLDFGIAKLLDQEGIPGETVTQARMMTPEYAAPEQVLGDSITTATDVYAIGVLIYELLSGRLPYARADVGTVSWSKAVVEDVPEPVHRAPTRKSTRGPDSADIAAARSIALPALRRNLRGDVDRILQRALAKSPEARYGTVSALTSDIEAYLNGYAISGGTRSYQFRKFARRHWLPLAAAATILLVLLTSGTAIVWQAHQLARASQNMLQVKDLLFGLFTAVDPHYAKGREISARELLDRGAKTIERNKLLDDEQKAEIESTLGRIYWQLALYEPAGKLQDSAINALRANNRNSLLLASTEADRATTLADLGDMTAAEALVSEARHAIDLLPDASITDRARVLHAQAVVTGWKRDFPKTKEIAVEEVALARQVAATDPKVLYRALMNQGVAEWGLTRIDDAEVSWREALSIASRDAAEDDLDVAVARGDVANALQTKSRYAEAEPFLQQVVSTEEKVLGADHPMTMAANRDLALTEYRLGYYAKARAMMEQVIAAQKAKLGADHPVIAGSEINLGYLLIDSGDLDTAEKVLTDSIAIFQKKYGRDYQGTRAALRVLAVAHTQQGKLNLAEQELNEVNAQEVKLALREKEGDETDRDLGDVKRLRGDGKAAVELTRQALAISVKKHGEESRYAADAHQHLGLALRDSGDTGGAEQQFRAALFSRASYLSNAEDPSGATTRLDLGLLLVGRPESRVEGVRLLSEAAALREKFLGENDPQTKQAQSVLMKVKS